MSARGSLAAAAHLGNEDLQRPARNTSPGPRLPAGPRPPKTFGWLLHYDTEGRTSVHAVDSDESPPTSGLFVIFASGWQGRFATLGDWAAVQTDVNCVLVAPCIGDDNICVRGNWL